MISFDSMKIGGLCTAKTNEQENENTILEINLPTCAALSNTR